MARELQVAHACSVFFIHMEEAEENRASPTHSGTCYEFLLFHLTRVLLLLLLAARNVFID
jgi:hypothetical protein